MSEANLSPIIPAPKVTSIFGNRIFRLAIKSLTENLALIITLVVILVGFSLWSPYFFNLYTFRGILEHGSFTLILAVGMTLVICTGGIDVSVGATLAFVSMLTAWLMVSGVPVILAVSVGLSAAAAIGAFNGFLVARLALQPFIVTLAMLSLARGATLILSDGYAIRDLPDGFTSFFAANGVFDSNVVFGFGALSLAILIMNFKPLGIHLRAIGSQPQTAFISGVPVPRMIIGVYVVQALLAALAGFTFTASIDAAEPTAGLSTEWLEAIAAPIIGGNSLSGGRARLVGTCLGCFILASMRSGLNIAGVPVAWQQVAIGGIIVLAVLVDVLIRNRRVS